MSPVAADRFVMGIAAFAFLMIAEFVLATAGFGWTPADYLRVLTTLEGVIGIVGQMFFALFPYLLLQRSAVDT